MRRPAILIAASLHLLTFSSSSLQVDKRAASSSRAETPIAADQKDLDALEQKLAELRQRKERLGREVELLEEKAGAH
jgi:cell division protein FtsB